MVELDHLSDILDVDTAPFTERPRHADQSLAYGLYCRRHLGGEYADRQRRGWRNSALYSDRDAFCSRGDPVDSIHTGTAGTYRKLALISVTFGGLHFGVLFYALSMIDAGPVAVIILLGVPFSSMLATYFFNDRLGWKRLSGMALAFIGVTIMFWDPTMTELQLPLLLVVFASFMWAVANVMIKKLGDIDTFQLNGWMALMAAPQLLVLSLIFEPHAFQAIAEASWVAWANLTFTVVMSSIVAYGFGTTC